MATIEAAQVHSIREGDHLMTSTTKKSRKMQLRRLVLVTALTFALGEMAMAQTAASSPAPAGKNASTEMVLEEVIVTAQKRAEPLQKTPIALTAFTENDLEKMQIANVMDLANNVPSVVIVPFTGDRAAPNMFIRGMGGLDSQTTKDNPTGIYVDGVSIGRGTGLAADLADLERVEVLRGPQGTLYGRNTTAGAINFITRKPEKEFSFQQELNAGNYDLLSLRTRVNIPLTESLYTRFTYMRSSNDGWVKNTNTTLPDQTDFYKEKKEALKWAFRLRATDNLMVDYAVDSSKMTYGNMFFQIVQGPTAFIGRQEEKNSTKGISPSEANVDGHNLTLTWDLGGTVFKSITGYRKLDSSSNQNFVDIATLGDKVTQDQTSQEFQVIGDTLGTRLKYAAGVYYFKENSDEGFRSSYGPTLPDNWSVKASSESTALYGQATWKPAVLDDRLSLTMGLRNTHDTREATKTFIVSGFFPGANGSVVPAKKTFSKVNPSLTADYAFSNDVSGYAKVGTGYRAGGFNTRSTLAGFSQGFNQENVRAYEVGMKSDLFERRVRLNVAAFQNDYTDLQVDQVRVPAIFTDTLNAGKAKVKGLELELKALLLKGLSANMSYSYLNGEYGTYMDNGKDLASVKHMPYTPKSQGSVGVEYSPAKTDYGKLTFNLDYKWQDEWYSNPSTLNPGGYEIWNARMELADIRAAKGTVRVAAWAKNLTDRKYRLATSNLGLLSAIYGEPRTLGLNLAYDY